MAGHGLGGDFNYYKLMTELRTYRKVGRSQVLALRLMGGIGFGDIPGNDLFTLGGADTLRGYEDDEFRGKRFYEGTLEYRFPIMKKVQGVLFIDAGNAWSGTDSLFWYEGNNKLHYAGGIGVRIKTPIGPVRLDYGRGSEGGKFNFSFGGQF
jgi:outer membrane protein insertion porin family